jgi:O-antigen/teichoic acid export membrane protein
MRKKFAVNLFFLLFASLLVKPYWILGVDRVVQNIVGPAEYGTYFAVFNYSFLFNIVLDFGINNFNNRAISRNNKRVGDYLLNLLLIKLTLSVIYLVVTFFSALATGFSERQMYMLVLLAINQILLSAILYFRSNIAALQMFKTDSFISVLDRLLTIAFCSVLMFLPALKSSFNIFWFIYAQTAALFFTALIAFLAVAGKTSLSFNLWKSKFRKMILLKSMPFALLAFLMGIYYRIDGVMLERLLPDGAEQAGIYAASFRMLDAVNMFGYMFATLLLPMFAAMIRKNHPVKPLVKFSSELMFAGSVMVSLACFFFRNEIMQLLYPASTEHWWLIFGLLMFNFIPMSTIYIYGTLLTAKGSMRALNTIATVGVIFNVGINLFLIPLKGTMGAVIATLFTQTITALAHIWVASREFKFGFSFNELKRLAAFVPICMLILFAGYMAPFHWMINLLVSVSLCGVVMLLLKIVPIAELLSLVKQKTAS